MLNLFFLFKIRFFYSKYELEQYGLTVKCEYKNLTEIPTDKMPNNVNKISMKGNRFYSVNLQDLRKFAESLRTLSLPGKCFKTL